ncbi:MAG: hypothetical protein WBC93_20635 [Sulfitobacter sp.]
MQVHSGGKNRIEANINGHFGDLCRASASSALQLHLSAASAIAGRANGRFVRDLILERVASASARMNDRFFRQQRHRDLRRSSNIHAASARSTKSIGLRRAEAVWKLSWFSVRAFINKISQVFLFLDHLGVHYTVGGRQQRSHRVSQGSI